MTNDDVLYAYRLRVLASARELGSVAAACRLHGIHRSTFYRWKAQVERFGLEVLRPRERRRPQMPNAIPVLIEQRIVAFALGHPGYGPAHIASELARPKWGGFTVSANGVWRVLRRHGIGTRALRYGLLAGYASPPEPSRDPEPERHIEVDHPGELVQMDCFCIGRLAGTRGVVWQYTAIDAASAFTWAELHVTPRNPDVGVDNPACAPGRRRAERRRLGARARLHRQRLGVPQPELRRGPCGARRQAHADQLRQAAVERLRRARAAHHPGRVLEAGLRPLPRAPLRGPAAGARALPRALQLRPHTQRTAHQGQDPGRGPRRR
jgi:transposase